MNFNITKKIIEKIIELEFRIDQIISRPPQFRCVAFVRQASSCKSKIQVMMGVFHHTDPLHLSYPIILCNLSNPTVIRDPPLIVRMRCVQNCGGSPLGNSKWVRFTHKAHLIHFPDYGGMRMESNAAAPFQARYFIHPWNISFLSSFVFFFKFNLI